MASGRDLGSRCGPLLSVVVFVAAGENPSSTLSGPTMAASLDVISFLKASLCISATSQTLQVRCLRAKSSIQCPSRVTTASSDVVPSLEALPLEPLFGGGLCLQRGDWPGRTASCNTGLPMRELLLSGATSSGSCRRRSPILPTFSSARSCSPFSVVGVEGACLRGSSLFFQLRPVSAACQGDRKSVV